MTIEASVPIRSVMSSAVITSRADADVESLIALMTDHQVGCIPIVDSSDRPIGIVTKLDLIENRHIDARTAREVMMPCAMTLMPTDSVTRAAKLMSAEGFHHVLVVDKADRTLVGVLSTFDVTRWLASCA